MSKRCILIGTVILLSLLAVGCNGDAQPAQPSQVVAQDIMLGADSTEGAPEITTPPDTMNFAGQEADALAEEKDYLQNEIDTLNEKIENLTWLRDSYIQENPTDLESKLAECDELIAQAQAELKELQDRMTRNEQNLGTLSGDEPVAAPEDIPQEDPLETPLDSPLQTPEDSTPVS